LEIWNSLSINFGFKIEEDWSPLKINFTKHYVKSILTQFVRKLEIEILENEIKLVSYFKLEFMKTSVNLKETLLDMKNVAIMEFLVVKRHLESVFEIFLQFDKKYLILPLESMLIYSLIQEIDDVIDLRRNQRHLCESERRWIFAEEGNKTIHFFKDSETLFKCEGGFYSASQLMAIKDNQLDWIWALMVLLAFGITILFNRGSIN
jgi:hypothetical protein